MQVYIYIYICDYICVYIYIMIIYLYTYNIYVITYVSYCIYTCSYTCDVSIWLVPKHSDSINWNTVDMLRVSLALEKHQKNHFALRGECTCTSRMPLAIELVRAVGSDGSDMWKGGPLEEHHNDVVNIQIVGKCNELWPETMFWDIPPLPSFHPLPLAATVAVHKSTSFQVKTCENQPEQFATGEVFPSRKCSCTCLG